MDIAAPTGHEADKRTIHGYKDHILIKEETEIITAIKVMPANAEDGAQWIDLVMKFQDHYGFAPEDFRFDAD